MTESDFYKKETVARVLTAASNAVEKNLDSTPATARERIRAAAVFVAEEAGYPTKAEGLADAAIEWVTLLDSSTPAMVEELRRAAQEVREL